MAVTLPVVLALAALCCAAVAALEPAAAASTIVSYPESHDGIKGQKNQGCDKGCISGDVCHKAGTTWADDSIKSCKVFVCNTKKSKEGKLTYDVGTKRCPELPAAQETHERMQGNASAAYPACCDYLKPVLQ
ncbi:uncharacterized protein LOC127749509 isoform X2 [Frankliniella occidentalis]|uniref:Uncharacterized protein LOC127749509 isoform X2 n=1 Tax=Frankliniella occidentalis TaxID=133901 RepID=A0A9C6U0G5_FRAOC|nr:uncharacterized protein LOC127749509 isoform X2 [Frankliniella occidentalis]